MDCDDVDVDDDDDDGNDCVCDRVGILVVTIVSRTEAGNVRRDNDGVIVSIDMSS